MKYEIDPNSKEIQKRITFLRSYSETELRIEQRKILEPLECGVDVHNLEVYCIAITERKEGDPIITNDGFRQFKSYFRVIDYGCVIERYIADIKGVMYVATIPL